MFVCPPSVSTGNNILEALIIIIILYTQIYISGILLRKITLELVYGVISLGFLGCEALESIL